MEELKCPNCGTVFEVDESDYARIVSQIRDKEFDIELKRREQVLEEKNKSNIEIALMKQEKEQKETLDKKNAELSAKQTEILELKSKLASFDDEKKIAVMEAVSAKEKELQERSTKITDLQSQLKIKETENELNVKSIKESYEQKLKDKDEQIE
ncbi:MAG: hypothetical protein IJX16_07325 [Clostridia bacterium]|nr:hypothetical protein [Clostridia bacterium]